MALLGVGEEEKEGLTLALPVTVGGSVGVLEVTVEREGAGEALPSPPPSPPSPPPLPAEGLRDRLPVTLSVRVPLTLAVRRAEGEAVEEREASGEPEGEGEVEGVGE